MFSDFGVSFEVNVSRIAAANVSEFLCVRTANQACSNPDAPGLKPD